jgi:hypothetical protein
MGRPLKIKQSTTIDIGFNPYNDLDQPTVVIPTGLTGTEYTGVVGGAQVGVATAANPVIAISAKLPDQSEDNAYIITQKGATKYFVAIQTTILDEDIVAGNTYVISVAGDTQWDLIGAGINAGVGDLFTATKNGSDIPNGTGQVFRTGICSLVNVAASSLANGQMQMTVDYGTGAVQVSRVNNKYVWDCSVPPVKYLANFFDNGGSTADASGAQVATWTNGTGLYTLGEVSNYTS